MDRYLVASGSWQSTSVWSTTSGGSSGASVPTASNRVYISSTNNYVVTLTADAQALSILLYRGELITGVHNLTIQNFLTSNDNNSRRLTLGSGRIEVNAALNTVGEIFNLAGSNLTLTAGSSLLVINVRSGTSTIRTLNKTFNDVEIDFRNASATLNVTGSPTFRSLIIQSKSSSAHTVNFDSGSTITTRHFRAVGSSSGNRLKLGNGVASNLSIQLNGTSYGQFVNIDGLGGTGSANVPHYIGSNSIQTYSAGSRLWLLQDPPTMSTLVDDFAGTTFNTARWSRTNTGFGSIIQNNGLELGYSGGSSSSYNLSSNDTFNLSTSDLVMEITSNNITNFYSIVQGLNLRITPTQAILVDNNVDIATTPLQTYVRLRYTSGVLKLDTSINGTSWTTATGGKTIDALLLSSVRVGFTSTRDLTNGYLNLAYINPTLGPSVPTASFSQSATSGVRPLAVNFTDTSSGIPDSWLWAFGDSTTSTTQNPSKTYSVRGQYTVSLQVTNALGTNTVTKTNLILAYDLFDRTVSGTFILGGGVDSSRLLSRTASGTLLLGGGVSRTQIHIKQVGGTFLLGGGVNYYVLRNTEAIEEKRYLYKVYDEDGTYIETWKDPVDDPEFTTEINELGSTMTIILPVNSDSLETSTSVLQDDTGAPILTNSDQALLVTTKSKNRIGAGSSIVHNNRVDVYVFYGEVSPLLTNLNEPVLTESGEPILVTTGSPNGRRIFTGFISEINSRYGNTETTIVQLSSYGYDLDQFVITDGLNTTVTYNSTDPSNIAISLIDKFVTASSAFNTYTDKTDSSISLSGTAVSYTFRVNKYGEGLKKVLELLPSNWYFRIDLGDNNVYFRERSATPVHRFYLGKHIKSLDLKSTIIDVKNDVYFTGGGDPALFKRYTEAPAPRTRRGLSLYSDQRVTVEDSADVISEGIIDEANKVQYRSTIEILTKVYDIESIRVGDVVGFRNFDNFVDLLTMQVQGINYTPDSVVLALQTLPPSVNKRLADIQRNLTVTENQNVPNAPTI